MAGFFVNLLMIDSVITSSKSDNAETMFQVGHSRMNFINYFYNN